MIKEFTVGCEKVFNLGNYQSIRCRGDLTITVAEGEDYETLKAQAMKDLKALVDEVYRTEMARAREGQT